ncbi:MAG: tail fiber domain-containing protein [Hyphomicrobiales bacterium]
MDDYGRQTNDARLDAILKGGQEQSRLADLDEHRARLENDAQAQAFGQGAARAGFHNQAEVQGANADIARFNTQQAARRQALQEKFALRNQPLNEIIGLLGQSQVRDPSFVNPPSAQIAGTDYAGLQSRYDALAQQRYRQKLAGWEDTMGGLFGTGAAGILASDRRVKTNIKRVGKTRDGQPIYRFRYKSGGPIQMGLMAQDVEKTKPQAVKTVNGVKMVDYGKALP